MKNKTKYKIIFFIFIGLVITGYCIVNSVLESWSWDDSIILVIAGLSATVGYYTLHNTEFQEDLTEEEKEEIRAITEVLK